MPYKDLEKQRAAQHRSYERNKAAIKDRQRERRQQPGYRDGEYAKRTPQPRPKRTPQPRPPGRVEALRASRPRTISAEEQAFIDAQRAMKQAALRRFGLAR